MAEHVEPFLHQANWRRPVVESFEFRTEVITSQSGVEQRRALRRNARSVLEYQITLRGPDALKLRRQLNFWGAYPFAVPSWARRANVDGDVAVGVTEIPVQAPIAGLRPGHQVVIMSDGDPVIRGVVQQYPTHIEIDDPLIQVVPHDTPVYLLLTGYIPQGTPSTTLTDEVAQMQVRFEALPETIYFASAAPTLPQFDGLEVVELKPNWQGGLDTTHDYDVYTVDFGHGVAKRYHPVEFTRPVVKWSFRSLDRSRSNAVIALFHRLKGRLKSCYVPSHINDLPIEAVAKGDTRLTVPGKDAYLYWDPNVDRAIRIETADGAVWYNRVKGVQEGDGASIMLLETAIPSAAAIRKVSWMRRSRLASDLLVVSWITDAISECDLSFSTLEDNR